MRLPLRWDRPNREIVDADGNDVCSVDSDSFGYDDDDRHAAEIVAACNAHERLVEALADMAGLVRDGFHPMDIAVRRALGEAESILAEAKK